MRIILLALASLALSSCAVQAWPDCYATQTQSSGEWRYPTDTTASVYPNNAEVCIRIIPEVLGSGGTCELSFPKVDVETGYDFIQVYDWTKKDWVSKEVQPREKWTTSNGFFVYFKSDHSVQKSGFTIKWTCTGGSQPTGGDDNDNNNNGGEITVDLHLEENHRASHTERYDTEGSLVIRRGVDFKITINNGNLKHILMKARISDRSTKDFMLSTDGKWTNGWSAKAGAKGAVVISTKPTTAIAKYDIDFVMGDGKIVGDDVNVYLLCNAWNTEDMCGACGASQRTNMLIPDEGYAYYGSSNRWGKMKWGFDQYLIENLEVSMGSLDGLSWADRSDMALVTRYISWVGNNKLLHGRWDGEYGDGEEPNHWTDTTEIFKVYRETGKRVKYGQCWVFASMTVTIHRALGVCSRSLTNFDSAHEHPHGGVFDGIIDQYYLEKDDGYLYRQSDKSRDSVWNFHVWNEILLNRPDIPDAALKQLVNGEQAVDTTCQEMSDGRCQCGPGPIAVMKKGFKWMNDNPASTKRFDTRFVASETDAMEHCWIKRKGSSKYVPWRVDTHKIGQLSLTWDGKDLNRAPFYKKEKHEARIYVKEGEGFPDLFNAGSFLEFQELVRNSSAAQAVEGALVMDKAAMEKADIGDELTFSVQAKKIPAGKKAVAFITVEAVSYVGNLVMGEVKKEKCEISGSQRACTMKIGEKDYSKFTKKTLHFRVSASINAGSPDAMWEDSAMFVFGTPQIGWRNAVTGDKTPFEVEQGSIQKFRIRFRNGFKHTPLTKCVLSAYITGHEEGAACDDKAQMQGQEQDQADLTAGGQNKPDTDKPPQGGATAATTTPPTLTELRTRRVTYDVAAGKEVTMTVAAKGSIVGEHSIIATVNCQELLTVAGSHEFKVTKRTKPVQAFLKKEEVVQDLQKQKEKIQKLKQENQGTVPPPAPAQMDVEPPVVTPVQAAQLQGQQQAGDSQALEDPGQQTADMPISVQDQATGKLSIQTQSQSSQTTETSTQTSTQTSTVEKTKEILESIQQDLSDIDKQKTKQKQKQKRPQKQARD